MKAEQFAEWRSHPTTVEIFEALRATRDVDIQSLVDGNTLSSDPGETAQLTARLVGKIQGMNQVLDISFDPGEAEEEEQDNLHPAELDSEELY